MVIAKTAPTAIFPGLSLLQRGNQVFLLRILVPPESGGISPDVGGGSNRDPGRS